MTTAVGTLNWAQQTQGRLNRKEKFSIVRQGVKAQLKLLVGPLLANTANPSAINLDAIVEPDSQLARLAREKMEDVCSRSLNHHNGRSFIWASLLAQTCGHQPDAEILYVACMLHDLGLTEAHHGCSHSHCFTLDSVAAAAGVLNQAEPALAERVRESILLHINIDIPGADMGWEAHYLGAGTGFDVVGARLREIPQPIRRQVLQRLPKLDLQSELESSIGKECALRPDSRFAMLTRLGLLGLLRNSPIR